jgi:hypothetical protein
LALLGLVMSNGAALNFAAFLVGLIVFLLITACALPEYRAVITRFGGSLLGDTLRRKTA